MRNHFPVEELVADFRIDEGVLCWSGNRPPKRSGTPAGKVIRSGYVYLQYRSKYLAAHRIVWVLTHGRWPAGDLDHIDGCRSNNRPENLREATGRQNQANRGATGVVKFKGVALHSCGRFQAACDGRYIGLFVTAEEAAAAYDAEARIRFGEFARLNFGSSE